ncbi:MAG TPA: restriction endonuclease [Caldilineae bacterium]|nr:restriction endonuclease [Caldilineae bacterium]
MALWMVRAGKHGEREDLALEHNIAVIGWDELPDLSPIKAREELRTLLEQVYPDAKLKTRLNWESQLWPFIAEMKVGDLIALPLKTRSAIVIGRVTGPYTYRTDLPSGAHHTRPVEWLKEFPRSRFDQDLLYSFGAFMTVCRIRRNQAEERVRALLADQEALSKPEEEEEEAPVDLEQLAKDQIRDYIARKFRGHGLARLVAAVLEAQGFKVRVSPEGPDGGVDIIAGMGLLGFESPKLAVQVKSSDAPVDVKVLRELQGVMKSFGAEQGLIVSWGGFKSSVIKEAARHFFEIRLWDADHVVQAIQSHYTKLPNEIQAELPLKRVWMLTITEEE